MISAIKKTESLFLDNKEKKEYMKIARELMYPQSVVDEIKEAGSITQIENILTRARHTYL